MGSRIRKPKLENRNRKTEIGKPKSETKSEWNTKRESIKHFVEQLPSFKVWFKFLDVLYLAHPILQFWQNSFQSLFPLFHYHFVLWNWQYWHIWTGCLREREGIQCYSCCGIRLAIFYTEILMRKVVLWWFSWVKWVKNSTIQLFESKSWAEFTYHLTRP